MKTMGKTTAQEFIQNSFSPLIAVLCSPKVEDLANKNNLTFTELLQPFTSLEKEGQFREPGGTVCIVKNWKLLLRNINWKPLPPTEARQQLNSAAISTYHDNIVTIEVEGRKIDIPQSTPWFDAWRQTYLEVQFPSDHEFTKHFLACIIIGSANEDNIIDTFNGLNQQYVHLQNVTPPKLPKWFNNDILKSYILLHDTSSVTKENADSAFDTLRNSFGSNNCFMLSINSKSTTDPSLPVDFWANCLSRINRNNDQLYSSTNMLPEPPTISVTSPDDTASSGPEVYHPLTTAVDDIYDNAYSLLAHSFSGSSESVSVSGKAFDLSTEVHGSALNSNDIEAIKRFLHDFAFKALLPHLEKLISQLSEGVATRKGVSRSLISATKRWFGTGKSGNATVNNAIIYSNDCPELQLRRLGDLWFLLGQWQRAFDVYHAAKREFYADGAWLCYAGALEMAALSAFMSGESNRKTQAYMEESIVTYLNTCRMVQFAVRATLLSTLCLSTAGLHGEAAKQLIRMTSEDSDLRSAMLLEQAALCFLSGPGTKPMARKYAFHIVLAGHRFSKAGQKKHAYRCYKQAYQVYGESGWRLATDHVEFALGRLAGGVGRAGDAALWLRRPLAPHSLQPPHQQAAFLTEYMLAHQKWRESSEEFKECLPVLPLPLLDTAATTVLCVGPTPLSSPGRVPATSLSFTEEQNHSVSQCYVKMEEMLLQVAQNGVPMIFKPTVDLYTAKTDSNPIVSQGEPIQIAITLRNPLKIVLMLKNVELLWQFHVNPEDNEEAMSEVLNNEPALAAGKALDSNAICGQKIKAVWLEGNCSKVLNFIITPLKVGKLNIEGLAYTLVNTGESGNETESLNILGKLDCLSDISDKRTKIKVIPHSPCLQMTFSETSPEVFSGEIRSIDVEFRNVGPVDMKRIFVAVSHPDCISLVSPNDTKTDFKQIYDEKYREPVSYQDERSARAAWWRAVSARHVRAVGSAVGRGAACRVRLLLRPHALAPALHLLAYYETANPERPYRLLRHTFNFHVIEAVEISLVPRRSLENSQGQLAENMNLVVEIKNVTDESNGKLFAEVLEVSLLSRQWKLTDTTRSLCKNDVLVAHERLHLIFRARRLLEGCPNEKIEYSCFKVASGSDSEVNVTELPYYEFLIDFQPFFIENLDTFSQKPNKSMGLIQSMFVIRWKVYNEAKSGVAIGQHCIWLDCFKKTDSNTSKITLPKTPALQFDEIETKPYVKKKTIKSSQQNCVVFRLEHSNHISHNFKNNKLCLVPVTLNVVNCYGIPVCVFIDTSKEQNTNLSLLGWAGALNSDLLNPNKIGLSLDLGMYESKRVEMRAVCASPGTYTLGSNFSMTALRKCDQQPVSQNIDNCSLLVVQSLF